MPHYRQQTGITGPPLGNTELSKVLHWMYNGSQCISPKLQGQDPRSSALKPLLPLKCHTKIIPTSCGVTLQLEPSATAGMFIPITATHRQQPCFQQTSDQQSNISLCFRQSEFKKKGMPLKKKISFLQQSLEKTFRFLLAQTHSACSTSSGIHGPTRAEKSKGMCRNLLKPNH